MGAKVGIFFIVLWTMIQAIGYGAMSLLAVLAHNCEIQMLDSRIIHFMYAIYFRDNECGPINWNLILDQTPPFLPTMPDVTQAAFRTNIIAIVILSVCCLWLLTSIFLFAVTTISCCGRMCYTSFIWTWIIATVLVSIVDLAATGIFTWDLVNAMTVDTFLTHFEITIPAGTSLDIPSYVLPAPSAILLAVAVRGIIFWILNVALIFVAYNLGKSIALSYYNSKFVDVVRPHLSTSADATRPQPYSNNNVETTYKQDQYPMHTRAIVQSRYEDSAPQQLERSPITYHAPLARAIVQARQEHPSHQSTHVPKTNLPVHERRYFEPLKRGDSTSPPPQTVDKSISHEVNGRKAVVNSTYYPDEQLRQSPMNKIPHITGNLLEQQRISIERPHLKKQPPPILPKPIRDPPPASTNVQRNSSTTGAQHHQHNAAPPDELRGQLPWSYFKNRNDISGPKKTFTQLREDEDLPPVPVPDYTLHFPRNVRPSTNSSDEGGKYGRVKR